MSLAKLSRILRRAVLFPAMGLGLVACASESQRLAEDDATCRSVGFVAGTESFSRCLLDLQIARRHAHSRLHH